MQRVGDNVKIAFIQAHIGRISWNEPVNPVFVGEIKRLMPTCIRPIDIEAEENALLLLGIKPDGNPDEFLNCL